MGWVEQQRTLKGKRQESIGENVGRKTGHGEDLCELIYLVYPKTLLVGFLPAMVVLLNPERCSGA